MNEFDWLSAIVESRFICGARGLVDNLRMALKEKILDEELATTEKSCLGCVADDISWEIYYLLKENKE